MYPMIENPWVTGDGPWNEPDPEVLEECAECKCDLVHGDEVYEIDGEFYCTDCITEDEYESGKCSCCGTEEFEQGEKIYVTKDRKKLFCWDCVGSKTLDAENYENDWRDEDW